jgi:hypothetical protein
MCETGKMKASSTSFWRSGMNRATRNRLWADRCYQSGTTWKLSWRQSDSIRWWWSVATLAVARVPRFVSQVWSPDIFMNSRSETAKFKILWSEIHTINDVRSCVLFTASNWSCLYVLQNMSSKMLFKLNVSETCLFLRSFVVFYIWMLLYSL